MNLVEMKTFDTNFTNYHEFLNAVSNACQFVKFVSKVRFNDATIQRLNAFHDPL